MSKNSAKKAVARNKIGESIRLIFQYTKFGTVGALATLVHIVMFVTLIETFGVWELFANFIAYCAAVGVSFIGHSYWTFKEPSRNAKQRLTKQNAFIRFWLVSLSGLIINTTIVFLVTEIWHASYYYAIALMVTVTPLFVFSVSKTWVFK